jgi:galactose oxidase-like protein
VKAFGQVVVMALSLLLAAAGGAAAHGLEQHAGTGQELPEKRLFAIEKATLGLEHAREHAAGRRLERELRREGAPTAKLQASGTVFSGAASDDGIVRNAADAPAAEVGRWQPPFSIPVMAINAAMLPTGKVLWFSYPVNPNPIAGGPDVVNTAQAWLWDPATGRTKRVDPPLWLDPKDGKMKPANIWCAGTSFLADGRVVVAGGNLDYRVPGVAGKEFKGLDKVYTFDPFSETWTEQPDMEDGRWYPSQARLPDGRTVILSGLDSSGRTDIYPTNKSIEVLTPSDESNLRGVGQVDRIPGNRGDVGMPPDGGLYPHTFWMPSGKLLIAGPEENDFWYLDGADPGKSLSDQWSLLFPQQNRTERLFGTGVQVPNKPGAGPSTKYMQIGGWSDFNSPGNTATTETFDEADYQQNVKTWVNTPSLNTPRSHANTVLLPDGSMVEVGGGLGKDPTLQQWAAEPADRNVELWDPDTGQWTEGAAQQEYRTYHSTALLLPDGRVVSAGDDYNGGWDRDSAEIYEPPYLFKGPRPVISGAPGLAALGGTLDVATPDPSHVENAALVAPGATTHANDMNQRYYALQTTPGVGQVSMSLPASPNALLPGWYMLFLISDKGVPSVATWVRVGLPGTAAPGQLIVEEKASPADGARFGFTGAPFVDFDLADGEARSATVMAGTYDVTQSAGGAHALRSIACDDGVLSPSAADVAGRRATIRVSPGEVVRCTFTNATDPPVVPPPPLPPTPPTKPPAAADRTKPAIGKVAFDRRHAALTGSATDTGGIARVDVALGRRADGRCRWWTRSKRKLAAKRVTCRKPVLMRATLTRTKAGARWTVRLGRRPAAGSYVVVVQARDRSGNVKNRTVALRIKAR